MLTLNVEKSQISKTRHNLSWVSVYRGSVVPQYATSRGPTFPCPLEGLSYTFGEFQSHMMVWSRDIATYRRKGPNSSNPAQTELESGVQRRRTASVCHVQSAADIPMPSRGSQL